MDTELLQALAAIIDAKLDEMERDLSRAIDEKLNLMKCEMSGEIEEKLIKAKGELKLDMKHNKNDLQNEIRKSADLVLEEVERVHKILDIHKSDKSKHTA